MCTDGKKGSNLEQLFLESAGPKGPGQRPQEWGKKTPAAKVRFEQVSASINNIKTQDYFLFTQAFVYYLLKVCAKKLGQKLENSETELNVKGYLL